MIIWEQLNFLLPHSPTKAFLLLLLFSIPSSPLNIFLTHECAFNGTTNIRHHRHWRRQEQREPQSNGNVERALVVHSIHSVPFRPPSSVPRPHTCRAACPILRAWRRAAESGRGNFEEDLGRSTKSGRLNGFYYGSRNNKWAFYVELRRWAGAKTHASSSSAIVVVVARWSVTGGDWLDDEQTFDYSASSRGWRIGLEYTWLWGADWSSLLLLLCRLK